MQTSDDVLRVNRRVAIPLREIRFETAHAAGPGGQNVNRRLTQVTACLPVSTSSSLTAAQRARVTAALRNRINAAGDLRVTARSARTQAQNRRRALNRMRELLAQALKPVKRRKRTRPTRAARERRLRAKKRRSALKQQRRAGWDET